MHGFDHAGGGSKFLPQRCDDHIDHVSSAVVLDSPHIAEQFDSAYRFALSQCQVAHDLEFLAGEISRAPIENYCSAPLVEKAVLLRADFGGCQPREPTVHRSWTHIEFET